MALQIVDLGPSVVHRTEDHKSGGHQNKAVTGIPTPPPGPLEESIWKEDPAWGS